MARVDLTHHLYQFFPQLNGKTIEVPGSTIGDVIQGLETLAPGIGFYVCDERGRLRQHVNIYIGEERVSDRTTLTDLVAPQSRVLIVQALSGG